LYKTGISYLDLIWYSVMYSRIVFVVAYCTDAAGMTNLPNVHI